MTCVRKIKYTNLLALRATKRILTAARIEAAGLVLVVIAIVMGMKIALLGAV